jgi:hypothetical protein
MTEDIHEAIVAALQSTCDEFLESVRTIPLEWWNESVFRFFLMRQLSARGIQCRCEWNKVDIVILQPEHGVVLVELKFYDRRPHHDQADRILRYKGGPGPKNLDEFKNGLKRLRDNAAKPRNWGSTATRTSAPAAPRSCRPRGSRPRRCSP